MSDWADDLVRMMVVDKLLTPEHMAELLRQHCIPKTRVELVGRIHLDAKMEAARDKDALKFERNESALAALEHVMWRKREAQDE